MSESTNSKMASWMKLVGVCLAYSALASVLSFFIPTSMAIGIGVLAGLLLVYPVRQQSYKSSFVRWAMWSGLVALVITIMLAFASALFKQ